MGDLWGKSDPYVKLTLEDAKGEIHGDMKTSTKTDDLDPTWDDEAFSFAPEGPHLLDCSLRFRVNDTGLGPEVELGEALVPLKLVPLMEEGGEEKLFEFSLGIAHGKAPLGMIKDCMKCKMAYQSKKDCLCFYVL